MNQYPRKSVEFVIWHVLGRDQVGLWRQPPSSALWPHATPGGIFGLDSPPLRDLI
jgi:hypothetical protein